ncbi:uncharacterized protein [Venturia canescens]|uniref:uncharacterized protein n=1 Tax=Venturia canescens TaxID=32260 RepID=UPI001C9C7023|nr:uncharacterized protein LOC122415843 [Venturia canescens]
MRTVARGVSSKLLLRLLMVLTSLDSFSARSNPTLTTPPTSSVKNESGIGNRVNLLRSLDISRKFGCNDPQARAYNLRDLMERLELHGPGESTNQPPYMVVKRCDGHSGCCWSPDMACTLIDNSTYYEDIEIEVWSLLTKKSRRQWIRVEQHGKCSCEVMNSSDRERLKFEKPNVTLLR